MRISFDTASFDKRPKSLISVLSGIRAAGSFPLGHHREVEEIVCRTPSSTLNYCQYVVGSFGVSRESERVFLKNPNLGIRYLRVVNRERFEDEDTQKRFWRKVLKDPNLVLEWSRAFRKRVSEEEEMVFVSSPLSCARQYAREVIKGSFPEGVHSRLVLRSFESLDRWDDQSLKEYIRWSEQFKANLEGIKS
jgi:hypothetical protein